MDGDTRVFKLTAQDGHSEVLPGKDRTRTWGFNGPFLGPTLRARRGDKIRAEITNDLIDCLLYTSDAADEGGIV